MGRPQTVERTLVVNHPKRDDADAFDDLLGQLVDELAMTPTAEPEPEPVPEIAVEELHPYWPGGIDGDGARMGRPAGNSGLLKFAIVTVCAAGVVVYVLSQTMGSPKESSARNNGATPAMASVGAGKTAAEDAAAAKKAAEEAAAAALAAQAALEAQKAEDAIQAARLAEEAKKAEEAEAAKKKASRSRRRSSRSSSSKSSKSDSGTKKTGRKRDDFDDL